MTVPIKIKRRTLSSGAGAPPSLLQGELSFNEHEQQLYIGAEASAIFIIGGQGKFVPWPGTGFIAQTAGASGSTPPTSAARSIQGSANQINVVNGSGISGDPVISITDNVILPGTGAVRIPSGTTAQQPSGTAGDIRYNSTTDQFEVRRASSWEDMGLGSGAPDQNLFQTFVPDSGITPSPTSPTDALTIAGGDGISTVGSGSPDTITIGMDISNLTTIPSALNSLDVIAIYDNDIGAHRGLPVSTLFNSPALTGNPTAPTLANTDNDTSIATTAHVKSVRLDQFAAPISNVDVNNQLIINVATPTSDDHAANKGYVDSLSQGLDVKASVRANSDSTSTEGTGYSYTPTGGSSGRGQITWTSGPTAIDGVTLADNDRILNSETGAASGIWIRTSTNTWDRSTDFDADSEVSSGAFTFVEEGTNYADSGWVLTTDNPIIIGGGSGTSLAWTQFSGAGQVVAGDGISKAGSTISVNVDDITIEIVTDTLQVKNGTANQALITNGAGTAAVWGAIDISSSSAVTNILDETNGGTGLSSFLTGDIMYASGSNVLSKLAIGAAGNVLHIVGGVPAWATEIDGGTF